MINLLLRNNFYPVMPYRRVRKESDELLYILVIVYLHEYLVTRYGPRSVAQRKWSRSLASRLCSNFKTARIRCFAMTIIIVVHGVFVV